MTEIDNMALLKLISNVTNTMSEGEVFQLMKCGDASLTEEDYLTIIEKKTAVLLSAACASGAILGSADPDKIEAFRQFGYKVGMAFQITDDTLDYMAEKQEFGKTIGKDLEEGKMTLPLIYTLQACTAEEREKVGGMLSEKIHNEETAAFIFRLIQKYQGVNYSLKSAARYINEAKSLLSVFPDCPEKNHLIAVAEYILSRKI